MTGRDLITYILENKLENQEVIQNGMVVGFLTADEAAVKFGVGESTIRVWVNQGLIAGVNINGGVCIPYNAVDPRPVNCKGDKVG